jgi:dTDP-4-amino-4,6-dideoxygalactose transaminase
MKINLFDLSRQISPLRKSFTKAFEEVLDKNEFTHGEQTVMLEKNFANFVDCKYALGVKSGTAALIVALKALELQKDDEVITTPMTFSATSDAIIHAGAKIVFADVDPKTGNLDPESIEKVKTKRTKAILLVHFAGVPCEMTKIVSFCKKNKLFLIEDASHAHGSIYKNKKIGSFGDLACFSFYPSKAFGSLGNAGIITTNNKKLLKKAQMFAEHGLYGKKYKHRLVGYNEKIDNLQSAFLNVKLPLLEGWIEKRLKIAKKYQAVFAKKGVKTVVWPEYSKPSLYIFSIFIKNRGKFAKYLSDNGVGSGTYYPTTLHLQESLKFLGYKKGDFPNAELYAKQTLSIPFYPELTNQEIDFICDLIKKYEF